MRPSKILAAQLCCAFVIQAQQPRKLEENLDDGKVVYRLLALKGDPLSFDGACALASEYVGEFSGKRHVLFMIAGDSAALGRAVVHGAVDGDAYAAALRSIERLGPAKGPIARVWDIDGVTSVTYRNGSELRQRILNGNHDPLWISENGFPFHLLHMRLRRMGQGSVRQPDYDLQVFADSAQPVSCAAVRRLTRRISGLTNASGVTLSVRSDPWFLNDVDYPDILPFQPSLQPPGRRQLLDSPSLRCSSMRGKISCSGVGFIP